MIFPWTYLKYEKLSQIRKNESIAEGTTQHARCRLILPKGRQLNFGMISLQYISACSIIGTMYNCHGDASYF